MEEIISLILAGKNVKVLAVAGSGKTSSILHVASQYKGTILVLTYNKKLQIETKQRAINLDNVSIFTLHGFCGHVSGKVCFDDTTLIYATSKKINYDLIVVDEMQDFTKRYYEFVKDVISGNKKIPQLLFLGDKNQMIYGYKNASDKYLISADEYFNTVFETVHMDTSYRISKQICDFVNISFPTISIKAIKDGIKPFYYKMSMNKSLDIIADDIKKKLSNGYVPNDFFVLMWSIKSGWTYKDWDNISDKMNEFKIPIYVQSNDDETPSEKLIANKIVFCTFHKTKGLERKIVYILGFDKHHSIKYDTDTTNILYVATTRSLEELHLFQTHNTPWVSMESISKTCNMITDDITITDNSSTNVIFESVTSLCSHKSFEKIDSIMSQIIKTSVKRQDKIIDIPAYTKSIYPNCIEEISDIVGKGIIDYFDHLVYRGWKHELFKDRIKILIDDCLREKKYKRYQIKQYDWIEQKDIDRIIGRLCVAVNRIRWLTDEFEFKMECSNVVGCIDLLTKDSIYEFKCTKTDKPEHFIQLLIYGKMYEKIYKKKLLMKLYYPLIDTLYQIDSDLSFEEIYDILKK